MKSYLPASVLLFAMPVAAMVPGVNGWTSKSMGSTNGACAVLDYQLLDATG
jgi:hypothetical protein